MIRDILITIGAAFFLLIFAAMCYWYYQHTTAEYKQEAEKADQLLEQWEADKKAKPQPPAEISSIEHTTPTAEKSIAGATEGVVEDTVPSEPNPNPIEQIEETGETVVRVSPHGFGPYPVVPPDYPRQDVWDYTGPITAESELLLRVQIKLWKQGKRTLGGIMSDGLVYPTLPGVVYIEWEHLTLSDGTVKKTMSGMRGDPHKGRILIDIERRKGKGELTESDIPSDITVVNMAEAGIDPYQFLDLK